MFLSYVWNSCSNLRTALETPFGNREERRRFSIGNFLLNIVGNLGKMKLRSFDGNDEFFLSFRYNQDIEKRLFKENEGKEIPS